MTVPVRHVLERFPQQAALVVKLTKRSEDFRSLCEDYALVLDALAQLQARSGQPDGQMEEYRSYLLELELDIADALASEIF
jgi:hypothetical protein